VFDAPGLALIDEVFCFNDDFWFWLLIGNNGNFRT
jgi:hypothetical protein